jgi:hypothetical protein
LSQALVDELTSIAIAKINERRSDLLGMVEKRVGRLLSIHACKEMSVSYDTHDPPSYLNKFKSAEASRTGIMSFPRMKSCKHAMRHASIITCSLISSLSSMAEGSPLHAFARFSS